MTRLLVGYDGSNAARAAMGAAAALFPRAETTVVTVHAPTPALEAGALARIALPEAQLQELLAQIEHDRVGDATTRAHEGAELARAAGLVAGAEVLEAASPWRGLRDRARSGTDVLVCGTRGQGAADRILLGSTASGLLYHAELPLLVVPAGIGLDGPVYAGYDASEGSRAALRFAAEHLTGRPLLVAHAWRSPVRHSLRGHAFARSHSSRLEDYAASMDVVWAETAEATASDGVAVAQRLGLTAEADTPESGLGTWQAVLSGARQRGAMAILVGSRGRGAIAATVLGSVASGLVHAAMLPVIVVPDIGLPSVPGRA
jgi:nucleotide-binding universal stress UspA family protein